MDFNTFTMRFLIHIVTLLQILNLSVNVVQGQRVPPGVHPQHYQQQQQQQFQQQPQYQQQQYQQAPVQQVPVQQHQAPVQQHQVPVQQHQVPVQQHQVPVQHQQVPQQQQVPVQQVPHGHGHHQQGKILDTQNIMQEKDHIAEHMDVPLDTSKMTEQELQFHYFKMHDADNNNKLDGCELIKSLIHWHGGKLDNATAVSDEELISKVEVVLNIADGDDDGYISYQEYKKMTP